MNKKLNEKLEYLTEQYIRGLSDSLEFIDFTKVSEVIKGSSIMSLIKNNLLNETTENSLINIFGDEGDNKYYFSKLLNGEYNEFNINEFFENVDSDNATTLLFYSCHIQDILSIVIEGYTEEHIKDLLGGV